MFISEVVVGLETFKHNTISPSAFAFEQKVMASIFKTFYNQFLKIHIFNFEIHCYILRKF